MTFAVFDIETRVDKELVRSVFFADESLDAEESYRRMREQLQSESGGRSDFFPLSCHVPVSIAVGNVDERHVLTRVDTLAAEAYSEEQVVREFWERLERFPGTLVSFNGRSFDIPVLELQALRYGCAIPKHLGSARGFRHRYAELHYDLYDFLTNYGASRIRGGFDLLAKLAGLPGKKGVDGSMVQALWEEGKLDAIDRYCRDDVIQTYFLFLKLELVRGRLTAEQYAAACGASSSFGDEIGLVRS